MDLTLAEQGQGFVIALITGFALGAFYDVFRILRVFVHSEKRHIIFQDIFFCFTAAIASFLVALAVNWGEIRFYLLAGEAIGMCVYFLTLGEITLRLSRLILKVLKAVWRFLLKWLFRPVKALVFKIGRGLAAIGKKIGNITKIRIKIKNKNEKQLESTPPDSV